MKRKIFISYSRVDEKWKEIVVKHLKLLPNIDIWDDSRIDGGARWFQEIKEALISSKIAILLISADFLTSRFIGENEVPPLLERHERGEVIIFPIILRPCFWELTWVADFNVRPRNGKPLREMSGPEGSESELVTIVREISKLLDKAAAREQKLSEYELALRKTLEKNWPDIDGVRKQCRQKSQELTNTDITAVEKSIIAEVKAEYDEKLRVYGLAFREVLAKTWPDVDGARNQCRQTSQGLTDADITAVEKSIIAEVKAEYEKKLREYELAFRKTLVQTWPDVDKAHEQCREKSQGLTDVDITAIEQPIIAEVKAKYEKKLREYGSTFGEALAKTWPDVDKAREQCRQKSQRLTDADITAIEKPIIAKVKAAYEQKLGEYELAFGEALAKTWPNVDGTREQCRQKSQGLTDADITAIEQPIIAKVKAEYEKKLREYGSAFGEALAKTWPDVDEARKQCREKSQELTDADITATEKSIIEKTNAEYQQKLREYGLAFGEALAKTWPDVDKAREQCREKSQELTDADITAIEQPIIAKVKAEYEKKLREYGSAFGEALAKTWPNVDEARNQCQKKSQGLTDADITAVEKSIIAEVKAEYEKKLREYELAFRKTLVQTWPDVDKAHEQCREKSQGLTDVDITAIEQPIIAEVKAKYEKKLRAYESAFGEALAKTWPDVGEARKQCQQKSQELTDADITATEKSIIEKTNAEYQQKLREYGLAFGEALAKTWPDVGEARKQCQQKSQELTDADITATEKSIIEKTNAEYQQKLREYGLAFGEALAKTWPDVNKVRNQCREKSQGLTDADITAIEQPIIAKVKAEYEKKLREYGSAFGEALAKTWSDVGEARKQCQQKSQGLTDADITAIEKPLIEEAKVAYEKKLRAYELAFGEALAKIWPDVNEARKQCRQKSQGLTDADITAIEQPIIAKVKAEYEKKLREYGSAFGEALAKTWSDVGEARKQCQQKSQGLTDADITAIEQPIIAKVKAEYEKNLREYGSAFGEALAKTWPDVGEARKQCQQKSQGLTDADITAIEQPIIAKVKAEYEKNLREYGSAFRQAMAKTWPNINEARNQCRQKSQGLTDADITAIEKPLIEEAKVAYEKKLRAYELAFGEALAKIWPDVNEARKQCRQKSQGLTDADITTIEQSIIAKVKAEYEKNLREYGSAFRQAMAKTWPNINEARNQCRQKSQGLTDADITAIEKLIIAEVKAAYKQKLGEYESVFHRALAKTWPDVDEARNQCQQESQGLMNADITAIEKPVMAKAEMAYEQKLDEYKSAFRQALEKNWPDMDVARNRCWQKSQGLGDPDIATVEKAVSTEIEKEIIPPPPLPRPDPRKKKWVKIGIGIGSLLLVAVVIDVIDAVLEEKPVTVTEELELDLLEPVPITEPISAPEPITPKCEESYCMTVDDLTFSFKWLDDSMAEVEKAYEAISVGNRHPREIASKLTDRGMKWRLPTLKEFRKIAAKALEQYKHEPHKVAGKCFYISGYAKRRDALPCAYVDKNGKVTRKEIDRQDAVYLVFAHDNDNT